MAIVERDAELAAIDVAAAAACEGRGGVVLIEGPAGIGKSAVMDEARRRAAGSLRLLGARGGPLERDFSFGIVRQLLEIATAGRELPDAARTVLAEPVGETQGEGSFAVLHGLLWAVLDLGAEKPLMLAVDDLQWCDRPSLRFLAYLARRAEELPVLLLATVRTGEPDVPEDLLEAVRQAPAEILTPGPLSADGVAELLQGRLGTAAEPAFVAAAHTATSGNPLLVRELAAGLAADGVAPTAARAAAVRSVGPRAVSRTVGARLARLSADALATAQAVAILGDGVTVVEVARFAGLDEEAVAAATGPLAQADVLRSEPPLGFVHPLVADAVLQTLPPGERELRHARAASMLREAGAPHERIAGHLLRAPGDGQPWAVESLRATAATSMRRGAPEGAVAFLRRALDEPPDPGLRAGLLLELGLAEALSSGAGAVEHLRGALATLTDPAQRALAAAALGRTLLFTGESEEAARVARTVADELPDALADSRDGLEAFASMTAWFDDRAPLAPADSARHRDRVPGPGDGPGARMLAATTSFGWCIEGGSREETVALAQAALAEGTLVAADNGLLNIPPACVLAYAEHPDAVPSLEAALADAHRRGSLLAVAGSRLWLTYFRYLRSELEEAVAVGRQAIDDVRLWGFDHGPDYVSAFLIMALVARGELTEARAVLDASRRPTVLGEGSRHWHEAWLGLLVAERNDAEALALADRLERDFAHVRNPAASPWRLQRAVLRHRNGDREGAAADLEEQLQRARNWGAPGPIGAALRLRGELLDDEAALEEAVAVLETSTYRLDLARALLAVGRRIRLARQPTEARDPLRRSLEIAAICGAPGLVEEIRTELAAAGARPRTEALSGPESLTPSEKRIAGLAADGLTNRDIAQELFVTPKTVEVHLSAVYRKLGIASRRGLATALVAS